MAAFLTYERECADCNRAVTEAEDGVYLAVFAEVEEEAEDAGSRRADFVYRCPGCRERHGKGA